MSKTSFEELSETLSDLVKNPELLDCGSFNLLKVFQHAVSYTLNEQEDDVLVTFDKPAFLSELIIPRLRSFRRSGLYRSGKNIAQKLPKRKYVLNSGGNCLTNEKGQVVSSNTVNILEALGRENCLYAYREYRGKSEATGQDFNLSELSFYLENRPFDKVESKVRKELIDCLKRVKSSGAFPEKYIRNFRAKMQLFFNLFRSWYFILRSVKPEKLYFITHYHQEGLIAAAKILGIPAIELQHGLISANDFYYVYPDQFKSVMPKALFGDKILLFGDYWSSILDKGCEYPPEKRAIIGSYQYRPGRTAESIQEFGEKYSLIGKKVILIATQTGIPEYYYDYVSDLAPRMEQKHPEYMILIKPHPYQLGMDLLEELRSFGNVEVCSKTDDLMLALEFTDIQISLYSTTFYDAVGTGAINLSIYDHPLYRRYAELMIEDKIAHRLEHSDDPVEIANRIRSAGEEQEREYYYSGFRADFDKFA